MVTQENCEEEGTGSNHGFDGFGIFQRLCRFDLGSGQPTRSTPPGAPADLDQIGDTRPKTLCCEPKPKTRLKRLRLKADPLKSDLLETDPRLIR
jgi:hypothetical protein